MEWLPHTRFFLYMAAGPPAQARPALNLCHAMCPRRTEAKDRPISRPVRLDA